MKGLHLGIMCSWLTCGTTPFSLVSKPIFRAASSTRTQQKSPLNHRSLFSVALLQNDGVTVSAPSRGLLCLRAFGTRYRSYEHGIWAPSRSTIRQMKVADLRMELSFRGMDTKGNRDILMTRLLGVLDDQEKEPSHKKKSIVQMVDSDRLYVLRVNGYTTQNSGGAGVGLVLYDPDTDEEVWSGRIYVSNDRTSFEAEYTAIIMGVEYISKSLGVCKVIVQSSNETVVCQIRRIYKINKSILRKLFEREQQLEQDFKDFVIQEIPSKENVIASGLASKALATRKSSNIQENADGNSFVIDPMTNLDDDVISQNSESRNVLEVIPQQIEEDVQLVNVGLVDVESMHQANANSQHDLGGRDSSTSQHFPAIDKSRTYLLRFDGGSRGNPGIAGAGMVVYDDEGEEVWCGWKFHHDIATNNFAEYLGLVYGMKFAKFIGIQQLIVEGDSQLIVKQINGEYRCKDDKLKPMYLDVQAIAKEFNSFEIRHIRRDKNSRADQLANNAMDLQESGGLDLLAESDD